MGDSITDNWSRLELSGGFFPGLRTSEEADRQFIEHFLALGASIMTRECKDQNLLLP